MAHPISESALAAEHARLEAEYAGPVDISKLRQKVWQQYANPDLRLGSVCRRRKKLKRNPTSKYLGVHWDSARGKWIAQATVAGRKYPLGRHAEEEQAARTYDQFVHMMLGEHGVYNFPREVPGA